MMKHSDHPPAPLLVERVISGGQTGIDQMGLDVAKALGIHTGGTAPSGYLTEYGPDPSLWDYGLGEHESADYAPRTKQNVRDSDGTVVFGELTGGTKLTVATCAKLGKPCLANPDAEQLRAWLIERNIRTLNVAGSRGSKMTPGELERYRAVLTDALKDSTNTGI